MSRNVQTFLVEKTFFVSIEERKAVEKKLLLPGNLPPVITISRQHGCYGAETALELAELLGKGWLVIHREILEAIANDSGVEKQYLSQFDEKTIPWINEVINGFGKESFNDSTFLKYLTKLTNSLANRGRVIIVGRGANFILKEGFHVRLVGSKETRIKNLMQVNKYSKDQATQEVEESDKHRKNYTYKLFGKEIDDPVFYDLMINIDNMKFSEVAKVIFSSTKISSLFK